MTKKNIQKWSKMRLVKNWTKIVQKKPFRFEMLENTDQVVETPDRSMKKFVNLKIQKISKIFGKKTCHAEFRIYR